MNSIKILITAIIYTGISSGIAFAISYYANIHLVLCLIIANIINLSIWLSDNVKKDEKMDIFFSNLKVVETDNKYLNWFGQNTLAAIRELNGSIKLLQMLLTAN